MKLHACLVELFRLRVPRDLAPLLPEQSIKLSLRGYSLRDAHLHALLLAAREAASLHGSIRARR